MKHYCVHKFLALLLVAVGYVTSAWGQVASDGTTEYSTLEEAFEGAATGKTIKLLADVEDFGNINITDKSLTLNLNGKTISGTSIVIGSEASLTIGTSVVYPTVDANYQVTISQASGVINLSKSITVRDGGQFTLKRGKIVSQSVGVFVIGDKTGQTDIKSTATISGGYIRAQEFCLSPQGKGATINVGSSKNTNKNTKANQSPVMESLDNAVIGGNGTAGYGGTSITLDRACLLIGRIQTAGYAACGIYHPQEGTLTISHSTAKIVTFNGAGILMRGGTLNFTAGTVIATGDKDFTGKVGDSRVVVGTSGIVFDRDANYYAADNTSINISGTSTNITGAKSAIDLINANGYDVTNKIAVTGGKFSSDVTPYLKPGYEITENNGTYTAIKYLAQIGDTKYTSITDIKNALNEAADGSTLKILSDFSQLSYQLSFTKKITLDLNGRSAALHSLQITTGGDLTITDKSTDGAGILSLNGNGSAIQVSGGGIVTIEKGTIKNTFSSQDAHKNEVVRVIGDNATGAKSTLNIKGGKIATEGTPVAVLYKGATVNMMGGELTASGLACIAGNGGTDKNGISYGGTTINISGGTLNATPADASSAACGIYHPQEGTLNITGGTINVTDGVGVLVRGGQFSMTDGTINATGDATKLGTVGDSHVAIGTSGVILDRDCNYQSAEKAEVKIDKEAKVNGAKAAVELLNENNASIAEEAIQIKGGTYNTDISALLDENSVAVQQDGTYTVSTYYAQVGDQKYATLKEAVAAVTDGNKTVTLLNDVDLTDATEGGLLVAKGQDVTLDLNGKSIKGASNASYNIQIDGKLTLKDSKENSTGRIYTESPYYVSPKKEEAANNYDKCIVNINDGGEFVMESGHIYTVLDDAANKGHFAIGAAGTGKVTINGGIVEAGWYALAGNGAETKSTTFAINGGTLISTADYAIYHPQPGKLVVNGGTIYGEAGAIAMKRGDLEVNGGIITSKGKGNTGTWGDGTGNLGNAALNFCKLYGDVTATIKGGTITAEGDAVVVDAQPTAGKTAEVAISGGTYSSDVSKYCVDGFTATPNTDGTYGISEVGDAMVVYGDSYENLVAGGSATFDMDKMEKMLITADVADVDVSLARTYDNTGWHAICLPFDVTLTADMTAQFGFAKLYNLSLNESEAPVITFKSLQTGDVLPAGLPCLIKSNATGTQTLAVGKVDIKKDAMQTQTCTSIEETYTFYPVLQNTYTAEKNGYLLYSGDPSTFAYNQNAGAYVQPLRFYMTIQRKSDGTYILPSQSGAQKVRLQVIGDGEATGITDINDDAKAAQGKVYNLQGVQVGTSTEGLPSGVYIQNGRKIIVK